MGVTLPNEEILKTSDAVAVTVAAAGVAKTKEQVLTPEQQLAAERQAAREAEWVEFHEGPGKSFLTVKSHVEEIKAKWENWATTETVDTLRALGGNLRDSDFVLNKFEDYVVGGWGGSLERKIKNAQGVDIVIENGKEVAKLGSVDDDLKEVVSERVEKAFKLLNDGECGVEADGKNWFEKNFRTTEIGGSPALLIRGHGTLGRGDVEGLVVDNKTAGVLQGLIEGQCKDVELESVDFKKTVLGDGKERRGYSFEHILEPIRYQQKCDEYASSKDPRAAAMCEIATEAREEFMADTEDYIQLHGWIDSFSTGNWPAALQTEAAEFLDRFSQTFKGGQLQKIARGMAVASRRTMFVRRPDLVLRVGGKTGSGDKYDNV